MKFKALALTITFVFVMMFSGVIAATTELDDTDTSPDRQPFAPRTSPGLQSEHSTTDQFAPAQSDIEYVHATGETQPLASPPHDLDDPTIWVNTHNRAESLIIGTNKAQGNLSRAGVRTWNLDGTPVQKIRGIHANNIEVKEGFDFGDTTIPIVLTVDREEGSWGFHVFTIDTDPASSTYRQLREISGSNLDLSFEPYGSALYHFAEDDEWYVFVSSREGPYRIEQYELVERNGRVELASDEPVRTIRHRPTEDGNQQERVSDVIEGMVVDDARGVLLANEEEFGLHQYKAGPGGGTVGQTIDTLQYRDGRILPDAEGVSIVRTGPWSGYIVVVGQNGWDRSRYEIYDRESYEYIKSVEVVGNPENDELEEVIGTDGLATYHGYLNDQYPCGVLLVHSDNVEIGESTFKLVPLENVFSEEPMPAIGCRR